MDDAELLRLVNEVAAQVDGNADRAATEHYIEWLAHKTMDSFHHFAICGPHTPTTQAWHAGRAAATEAQVYRVLRALLRRELLGEGR